MGLVIMKIKCDNVNDCCEDNSMYEHSNKSIEFNTLTTHDDMRHHLLNYNVLIIEPSINDLLVECNGTLY